MTKNHRTTTVLVAIIVVAATLLAAGTVAALGSNYSAFAHKEYQKKYDKFNKEDKNGRDGDNIAVSNQYVKCIVIGDGMKRTGEKAAIVVPPPTDDSGRAIGSNSCNNNSPYNTNNDGSNGGPPKGDVRGM
jgi:hypothetical protein